MRGLTKERLDRIRTSRPPILSMVLPTRGPIAAGIRSEPEKAANTAAVLMPVSRAMGSASMASK